MKKRSIYRSDFLFASTNLWIGAGSVLNFFGNYYTFNASDSSRKADYKAILSDWGTIGLDMSGAAGKFKKTQRR